MKSEKSVFITKYISARNNPSTRHVINTTVSSNCFDCGASQSKMNEISKLGKQFHSEEVIHLGISLLHTRIKFQEVCCLPGL